MDPLVQLTLPVIAGLLLALRFASAFQRNRFFYAAVPVYLAAAMAAGMVADQFGIADWIEFVLSPDWLPPLQIVELLFCAAVVSRFSHLLIVPTPVVVAWMILSCSLIQQNVRNMEGLTIGALVGLGFVLAAFLFRLIKPGEGARLASALLVGIAVVFVPVSLNTHMPGNWGVPALDTLPWLGICVATVSMAYLTTGAMNRLTKRSTQP